MHMTLQEGLFQKKKIQNKTDVMYKNINTKN